MSFKKLIRISLPLLLLAAGALLILNAARPAQETAARQQAVLAAAPQRDRVSEYPPQLEQYAPITPVTVNMRDVPVGVYAESNLYDRWLRGEVDLENDFRVSEAVAAGLMADAQKLAPNSDVQIAQTGFGPTPLIGFDSLDYTECCGGGGVVPPDPEMAAGPNHLIAVVNLALEIYDKSGNNLYGPVTTDSFFDAHPSCNGTFDPTVVYDESADRYVIGIDADGLYFCAAVSATSDPLGSWHIYAVQANIMGAFHDYPHIGVGNDAIFVGANQFGGAVPQGFEGRVWALNKAAMYSGGAMTPVTFSLGYDGSTPQPLHLHGYLQGTWPESNTHYIITDFYDGSTAWVWEWPDPVSGGSPAIVAVFDLGPGGFPINVPQQGGQTIQANDWRMRQFEYRNGSGWVTDTVSCNPGGGTVNCVRWTEIDLTTPTPTLVQTAIYGSNGDHRIFPDLAVNHCGDMAIGYTKSSASMYPSIWYTGRESGDPMGTLQPEAELKAGEVPYTAFDPAPRRWGDYTGMTIDPDGVTFWYLGEYSKDIPSQGKWGTYIGAFSYPECSVGDNPLYNMPYRIFLNDGSQSQGTYALFAGGAFTDSNGGGGIWGYLQDAEIFWLQHDPGYQCTSLDIGLYRGEGRVVGVNICQDFSGRKGFWLGGLQPGTLSSLPTRDLGHPDMPLPEGMTLDELLRQIPK
ncbi:MAG: hypothetical protein Fur0021_02750 [Candidatus Promineifilaceae bacterium]